MELIEQSCKENLYYYYCVSPLLSHTTLLTPDMWGVFAPTSSNSAKPTGHPIIQLNSDIEK